MVKRWISQALVGIVAGVLPASVSAQQPSPSDPVPLNRPMGDAAMYPGMQPGAGPMPAMYAQPGSPGQVPPPPMDSGMLHTPRPMGPGGAAPIEPGTEMTPDAARAPGTSRWVLDAEFVILARERMKHEALAIKDLILVEAPDPVPPGLTGMPLYADFRDMAMNPMYGFKVGAQYLFNENNAVEWTVMWLPQHTDKANYVLPGQLTSFFSGPATVPLGFEGDNGLWDHADQIIVNLTTTMTGTELNYRGYGGWNGWEFDWLIGARYLNIHEKLAITTDDDGIQFGADPLFSATYTVRARNSIVAGQLGVGLHTFVFGHNWWTLSWEAKGAWGQNFADYVIELQRGDGFSGPSGGLKKEHFAMIYESAVSTDFSGDWWRVRLGFTTMFINGVATAQNQVDFNLDNHNGAGIFNGNLFYWGPFASLQVVF